MDNENGDYHQSQRLFNQDTGLFAAGDVTDADHKQIVVAAGEDQSGASAYDYIKS